MAKAKTAATSKPVSKTAAKPKPAAAAVKKQAIPVTKKTPEKTGEDLVIENFTAVSHLVETIGETLEMLVHKTENMAYHIIATEEILAELIAANGIDLARVNARIRNTVSAGTDNLCDPSKAIDIAAAIASPLPRR